MDVICFSNISFSYGHSSVNNASQNNTVLENISFTIVENDFVAIIGRNGSGKSTLIKLMLGLLTQTKGEIHLLGKNPADFHQWNLLGYVPQRYEIDKFFPATIAEIFALKHCTGKDCMGKENIISLLSLDDKLKQKFAELSGGEQQKVLIGLSLLSNPKILILDEPTVGVDMKSQQQFYELLKKLNEENNITIILVTHDVGLIPKYVKSVICMTGKMCSTGKPNETAKLLKNIYGNEFEIHTH